jgi:excisionase family DNA binding protein
MRAKTIVLEQLLTQQQAADLCGMHLHSIIRARQAGELRSIVRGRMVRIRPSDLQAWLDSHAQGGDQ